MKYDGNDIEKTIVEKAKELGASLAGIAAITDLKASKSYEIYANRRSTKNTIANRRITQNSRAWNGAQSTNQCWCGRLSHPASEPALDWWSMKVKGFTPGNGVMRLQSKKLRIWLGEELGNQLPFRCPTRSSSAGLSSRIPPIWPAWGGSVKTTSWSRRSIGTRSVFEGSSWRLSSSQPVRIDFDPCNGCDMTLPPGLSKRCLPKRGLREGALQAGERQTRSRCGNTRWFDHGDRRAQRGDPSPAGTASSRAPSRRMPPADLW